MKILIVDSEVIPACLYGGTQRVIWYLGRDLARMGHEISYLVAPGSRCDFARVLAIDTQRPIVDQIPQGFDLIHFNFRPEGLDRLKTPYIITMHGNRNDQQPLDINTVFVSRNHAQRFGSGSYVYNGLDWDSYRKPELNKKRDYFHFLGKAAWRVKNINGAIGVITRTKRRRLAVLGGVRFNVNMGLRFTFTPRVSFHGMVGGMDKDRLLNDSQGMVFPVRWHEPFGLGMIESLFYGCPVFGTPYGSLPELIPPEVGFLSKHKHELAEAVENANDYSRQACHDYALENFASESMTRAYLVKYQRVLDGETLNREPPYLREMTPKLLEWRD
jgi:glycosyltransferase involved in cell wall biosynthesis